MKNKFYTIILAATFATSTALFCGNTPSTAKKPCECTKVEASSKLSELYESAKANLNSAWTNHRNYFYVGGAVVLVAGLVEAHKKGKLSCKGCPFGFGKKDKPSNP